MKIIVGLGNPTPKYRNNYHNLGFMTVDALAEKLKMKIKTSECKSLTAVKTIDGGDVVIAKPQTFMNLSGESVRSIADYYKIEPEDIIVAYDDIDLEVGQIRVRRKGSAGGHNGIKNIISHLGTNEFPRVKVGVGAKPQGGDLVNHVLGHFSREDEKKMDEVLDEAVAAVETIVTQDVDVAMNRFNAKKK